MPGLSTRSGSLDAVGAKQVQLLIMHPPYHDIISFSEDDKDLSNAATTDEFLKMFGDVLDNIGPVLERGRYFALVIGDKYSKGEWIPLGFLLHERGSQARLLAKEHRGEEL